VAGECQVEYLTEGQWNCPFAAGTRRTTIKQNILSSILALRSLRVFSRSIG
jgi:hypothetical protein